MKTIKINISSVKTSSLGAWNYTHYVTFPTKLTWSYTIITTLEGMMNTIAIWKEAGYEIIFLNNYPD